MMLSVSLRFSPCDLHTWLCASDYLGTSMEVTEYKEELELRSLSLPRPGQACYHIPITSRSCLALHVPRCASTRVVHRMESFLAQYDVRIPDLTNQIGTHAGSLLYTLAKARATVRRIWALKRESGNPVRQIYFFVSLCLIIGTDSSCGPNFKASSYLVAT